MLDKSPNYIELSYIYYSPRTNNNELALYKILFLIIFSLIGYNESLSQYNLPDTTSNTSKDTTEYFADEYSDLETNYFDPFYYKINLEAGYSYKNNMKLPSFSQKTYFNLSYSISYFMIPLEEVSSQVGFYNEIGLYNTSLYLNIGPEARIIYNFYIIPYFGIALVPFSKFQDQDIAFIYYLGISAGYYFKINQDIELKIEAATDFLKLKRNEDNTYLKVGFAFNLFNPY